MALPEDPRSHRSAGDAPAPPGPASPHGPRQAQDPEADRVPLKELASQNRFLVALLASIPSPVYYKDIQGRYLGCNLAFEELVGVSQQELRGRTAHQVWPERLADYYEARDRELFQSGGTQQYEYQIEDRRGQVRDMVFFKSTFIGGDDRIAGLVGVIMDITERKKLEEQLFHAQKMEAVGQLAGGVAHDFNNMLQAISGFANILKLKLAPADPSQALADQILAAADRAAGVTQDLLTFSRKQPVHLAPLDLNRAVAGLRGFLQRALGEEMELVTRLTAEGLVVMADENQLGQVLVNLANNARDAMAVRGKFTITTGAVQLDQAFIDRHGYGEAGRYAVLAAADTGCGMDKAVLDKVFVPFFTTKEQGKGTGLGLAIVYGIVKQHKGFVDVDSEPGQGSTFTIYLPLVPDAVEPGPDEAADVPPGGNELLLLAEDDPLVRSMTGTLLREAGYRVIEAVDGKEAVEKYLLYGNEIELLILDMVMPRMSGVEVAEFLKLAQPRINILFMSGYATEMLKKHGALIKEERWIAKPWTPAKFLRLVREALDDV